VALTVTLAVPEVAPEAAVNVSVLLPLPGDAMPAGEKLAETPFGNPLTDSATAELRY